MMPSHTVKGAVHKIVYWKRIGTLAEGGRPKVVNQPVQLIVRWDDTRRVILMPDGSTVAVDATICNVDRDLTIGGAVWRGGLADLPGDNQQPVMDVMEVVTESKSEDRRGRDVYREYTLIRSKDTLGPAGADPT